MSSAKMKEARLVKELLSQFYTIKNWTRKGCHVDAFTSANEATFGGYINILKSYEQKYKVYKNFYCIKTKFPHARVLRDINPQNYDEWYGEFYFSEDTLLYEKLKDKLRQEITEILK